MLFLKDKKMKTTYPTEQLSFNEWTAYIKSEQMKQYSENKTNTNTEQSFGKNQKQ